MTYQKALLTPTKATQPKHTSIPSQSPMQGQAAMHPMLQLQRQIGNRAVGGMIQAKLKIGAAQDKYEREADRIATEVVQRLHSPQPQTLQRQEREDENELQMKSENFLKGDTQRISQPLMTKAESIAGDTATPEFEASLNRAKGGGQPLSDKIRKPMEEALGAEFSGVKVHTDAQSDELNHSIQAKAFTTGQDIFFQQAAYDPGSRGGQELLAHELGHVVQQNRRVLQGAVRSSISLGRGETTKRTLRTNVIQRVKNKEDIINEKIDEIVQKNGKNDEEEQLEDYVERVIRENEKNYKDINFFLYFDQIQEKAERKWFSNNPEDDPFQQHVRSVGDIDLFEGVANIEQWKGLALGRAQDGRQREDSSLHQIKGTEGKGIPPLHHHTRPKANQSIWYVWSTDSQITVYALAEHKSSNKEYGQISGVDGIPQRWKLSK